MATIMKRGGGGEFEISTKLHLSRFIYRRLSTSTSDRFAFCNKIRRTFSIVERFMSFRGGAGGVGWEPGGYLSKSESYL